MDTRSKWVPMAAIAAVLGTPMALQLERGRDGLKVDATLVGTRTLMPSVLASGTLTYRSQATLTPEIIGRVREIRVAEGDRVRKGDVMMRIDAEAYRAEVAQYEAAVAQASLAIDRARYNREYQASKLARYEKLRAVGMVTAVMYDELQMQARGAEVALRDAQEALASARAQLAQSRERLSKTQIVAPMDGTVISVGIRVGETAVPSINNIAGSELLAIADTSTHYAEVNVDETDIAKLARGQPARVYAASAPAQALEATVDEISISPRLKAQGRSYAVKLRLPGPIPGGLRAGMSCRVEILTGTGARVVAIPQQALVTEDAGSSGHHSHIFVVENGVARRRDVDTGLADDTYIEVKQGLVADDLLITGPSRVLRALRDGERVLPARKDGDRDPPRGRG
jgi:HlyD family secretion protein